ncbi:unnamed protein product [Symbiodinium sp. CCMP2592]|nr:unnamed protein product [Symbiodinium sp. CCMP2592]
MPQLLLCLRNVVSGGTVAEIVGDSSWTSMEAALAVVASTGHNNFKLVKGSHCFFPGSATTLGEFAGEGETAELEILIQDFPILRISGIPADAAFGGHGPAIGSTTDSSSLHDLNGDWSAVPLLQVRGHPVWTKQTHLRNKWEPRSGLPADDGVRYIVLGGDGVLDIAWLPAGERPRSDSFPHQSSRHGFLAGFNFKELSESLIWETDGHPGKAHVLGVKALFLLPQGPGAFLEAGGKLGGRFCGARTLKHQKGQTHLQKGLAVS